MQIDAMVSRPRYTKISLRFGREHLLIVQDEQLLGGAFEPSVAMEDFDDIWTIASRSTALPDPGQLEKQFRSVNHLKLALDDRLKNETMGLRVYVVGDEEFVWDIDLRCRRFGLGNDEIWLFAPYLGPRRVRCAHCRSYTSDCTGTVVTCAGCGATLCVRDHFSRFWNAYQGFQIDSEEPGVVPESKAFQS